MSILDCSERNDAMLTVAKATMLHEKYNKHSLQDLGLRETPADSTVRDTIIDATQLTKQVAELHVAWAETGIQVGMA